jgi:hypothetical protein
MVLHLTIETYAARCEKFRGAGIELVNLPVNIDGMHLARSKEGGRTFNMTSENRGPGPSTSCVLSARRTTYSKQLWHGYSVNPLESSHQPILFFATGDRYNAPMGRH